MKATDIHTGYAPTVDDSAEKTWREKVAAYVDAAWNMTGVENRCGFVSYPSHAAFHRSGMVAVTPSLTFGNAGAGRSRQDAYMNYASHGKHIMGGSYAHFNRLAREIIYLNHNFAQFTGIRGLDPRDMLKNLTYKDEGGDWVHCQPLPFHAIEDSKLLAYWRGRYKWHWMTCEEHRIGVDKHSYKRARAKNQNTYTSDLNKLRKRTHIPRLSRNQLGASPISDQNTPPSPLIDYDHSDWPIGDPSPLVVSSAHQSPALPHHEDGPPISNSQTLENRAIDLPDHSPDKNEILFKTSHTSHQDPTVSLDFSKANVATSHLPVQSNITSTANTHTPLEEPNSETPGNGAGVADTSGTHAPHLCPLIRSNIYSEVNSTAPSTVNSKQIQIILHFYYQWC